MVTVYILQSNKDNIHYTGMALNAEARFKEHNEGKNKFTKGHRPWKIIYTEDYPDWKTARNREKYFKTSAGKKWLHKIINP